MTRSRNDVAGEYSETIDLTESEHHRLLSAARRRHALDVLLDRSDPVDLVELAETVADREDGLRPDEDLERVQTSLHHVHLPMLDEHDLVAYDAQECRAASCPSPADLPFY